MDQNLFIRPVTERDFEAVLGIASDTGPGFNSLPDHDAVIKAKIIRSIQSFAHKIEPNQRLYFFVMENKLTNEVIGTAAIEASIGHPWPFYKFKLSHFTQIQPVLKCYQEHSLLHLVNDHDSATELGTLYLKPAHRGEGRGKFLSRTRCLFMAIFPALFSELVVADMRGVSHVGGACPFWDAFGSRFLGISYEEASYHKATEGSQFLIDLLPRYPLYVDFFSDEARQTIGMTHELSLPALHILAKEGFVYRKYIDVLDGGPTIEVARQEIKTVQNTRVARVASLKKEIKSDTKMLISNTDMNFRSGVTNIELTPHGEVILSEKYAQLLTIDSGSKIAYCPF